MIAQKMVYQKRPESSFYRDPLRTGNMTDLMIIHEFQIKSRDLQEPSVVKLNFLYLIESQKSAKRIVLKRSQTSTGPQSFA